VEYLLVRALKKSGFPGSERWSLDSDDHPPELGGLIRACGNDFRRLSREKRDQWAAAAKELVEIGSTPEDAVGSLWLSLERRKLRRH
jgi:hypothetical protein